MEQGMRERLTLDEKASLTSGHGFWHTKAVDRLKIPSLLLTDGPHGVRKQREGEEHLGLAHSVPTTCFPPAAGLASSFDPELIERVGQALGAEAAHLGVGVLLGPGVNIKRSPLCGRNFEYFSEDPVVSGILGSAWIRGVQSHGVGACVKHFAANNQETDRMRVSSDLDERTLREIYLRAFQKVIEESNPWTVMCSYNQINGVSVSENEWLLSQVLRTEWGYDGVVMSDWGAVGNRILALSAGLDLEMPASGGRTDAELVAAIKEERLDPAHLEATVDRMLRLVARATVREDSGSAPDWDSHHALAREAAARSVVLLKNERNLLPLNRSDRVAVIGDFAANPRYQGAGSSLINPTRLDSALEEIRRLSEGEITYASGYSLDGSDVVANEELLVAAVTAAAAAETAVVFLGLPDAAESEGFDRTNIDLPKSQLELLDAVLAVNDRTIVVLSHGGVVALPFADRVSAILDGWLLGQAGGGGLADVLYGEVNPSGRLAETIPLRLSDTPSYLDFPGEFGHVRYSEGLFVGYRWYDSREVDVAFPFGHGLSYTNFEYSEVETSVTSRGDLEIDVRVTNVGPRAGREVVQAYTGVPDSAVIRPRRELKAFASVELQPGESKTVRLSVPRQDLAYWDTRIDDWVVESGFYRIDVGASSRDVRASIQMEVNGDDVRLPLTNQSSLSEVAAVPAAMQVLKSIAEKRGPDGQMLLRLFDQKSEIGILNASFPVGRLSMAGLSQEEIERLITAS